MKILIIFISILFIQNSAFSNEKSLYNFSWLDQDKKVYVLQNRYYRKDNSILFSLGGGITTSGSFLRAFNGQAKIGYFFSEDWGVELLYSMNTGEENESSLSIRNAGVIPFWRKMKNYYAASILWSPFYAKINIFNQILYFDWFFGVGYNYLTDENNKLEFDTQSSNPNLTEENFSGLYLSSNFLFYLSKNWALRFDISTVNYFSNKVDDQTIKVLNSHYDLTFGFSYKL